MYTMNNTVIYRDMLDKDKDQVFALVKASFDEFVFPDVTEEGADEFFRAAREMIYDRPAGHFILVALCKGTLAGMIDVRSNDHICLFFVDRKFNRQGIGGQLVDRAIERCAGDGARASCIEVNSSLYAVPVYRKLGFHKTQPEQFVNGIRFVPLVRTL